MNLEAVEILALLVGQASVDSSDCVTGGLGCDGAVVPLVEEGLDLLMCFKDRVIVGTSVRVRGEPEYEIKRLADGAGVGGQRSGVRELSEVFGDFGADLQELLGDGLAGETLFLHLSVDQILQPCAYLKVYGNGFGEVSRIGAVAEGQRAVGRTLGEGFGVNAQDAGEGGGGLDRRMYLDAVGLDDLGGPGLSGLNGAGGSADGFEQVVGTILFGDQDAKFARFVVNGMKRDGSDGESLKTGA